MSDTRDFQYELHMAECAHGSTKMLLDRILPYAVRYALGRRSFAVADVCDAVEREAAGLSDELRSVIARDIREALDRGETGDECDANRWRRALIALERVQP